ncbi:aldehyde dehydrogenase family protein [Romeria aff. gracilis LEGE 07310]|uniref:Gamma-glutamyl phosphate reductase n=1 Tax=Vasconcelosia minhoensis LEGE 07310 TaxID=915328 RepID=A0A8J7DQ91_9CYAN|nr:aldehyde dehydrogenase family protein [Romeria gracilis]MBE9076129.1 aldehyde dehydrogenase family protein [Romeria aff. gracilis LEGE 07310]
MVTTGSTGSTVEIAAALGRVRRAAAQIAQSAAARSAALANLGQAIQEHQDAILEANTLDLEVSREMAIPDLVVDWLKLTPERLQTAAQILHRLSALGDVEPVSPTSRPVSTVSQLRPLGVVALVYEAFPDLAAIAAGLCLRTGNGLVLRGGNEASQTNQVILDIMQDAIAAAELPSNCLYAVPAAQGGSSRFVIVQRPEIDLVIPYGRPSLVEQVMRQATVPVLPSRMGNCYLYWSASGKLDQVYQMIFESHLGNPDAINGIEKVLVHPAHRTAGLPRLWDRLLADGFEIRAEAEIAEGRHTIHLADPEDWSLSYLSRTVAFRWADDLDQAIDWMNRHSSGHADCLATTDYDESRKFSRKVGSASAYVNASPRFFRNAERANDVGLGMTNVVGRSGGLIGLEALVAHQRLIYGG